MPVLPASPLSSVLNLKLNLLDQSGLNFATFCCIELCCLMGIVSVIQCYASLYKKLQLQDVVF